MILVLTEVATTTKKNKRGDRNESRNPAPQPPMNPLTLPHTTNGPTRKRNPPPGYLPRLSRPPSTHRPTWTCHSSQSISLSPNPQSHSCLHNPRPGGPLSPPPLSGRDGIDHPLCPTASAISLCHLSRYGLAHTY